MTSRDYAAERYNRRTRAIEKQAHEVGRLADALTVIALASAAQTTSQTADGSSRKWKQPFATQLMGRLSSATERLVIR